MHHHVKLEIKICDNAVLKPSWNDSWGFMPHFRKEPEAGDGPPWLLATWLLNIRVQKILPLKMPLLVGKPNS